MKGRNSTKYEDINKVINKRETEDRLSFFIDDVTEDLKYK